MVRRCEHSHHGDEVGCFGSRRFPAGTAMRSAATGADERCDACWVRDLTFLLAGMMRTRCPDPCGFRSGII